MRSILFCLIAAGVLGCQSTEPTPSPPPPPPISPPAAASDDQTGLPQPLSPDEARFVDVYIRAGRPRMAIYVNPEFDGALIPPARPGSLNAPPVVFLKPGEYDSSQAASVDFSALENDLHDAMNCEGWVRVISPDFFADHVTAQDLQSLARGDAGVLSDLAGRTGE